MVGGQLGVEAWLEGASLESPKRQRGSFASNLPMVKNLLRTLSLPRGAVRSGAGYGGTVGGGLGTAFV